MHPRQTESHPGWCADLEVDLRRWTPASLGPYAHGGGRGRDLHPVLGRRVRLHSHGVSIPRAHGDLASVRVDLEPLAPTHDDAGIGLLRRNRKNTGDESEEHV